LRTGMRCGRLRVAAYYNENDGYCAAWLRNLAPPGWWRTGSAVMRFSLS
jgi:hypothetical protein